MLKIKTFIFKFYQNLFNILFYNWHPTWYELNSRINMVPTLFEGLNLRMLLETILINPFNEKTPKFLSDVKNIDWKNMKGLSLKLYRILVSVQFTLSLLTFIFFFGIFLWMPFRILFQLFIANLALRFPIFQDLTNLIYGYAINTVNYISYILTGDYSRPFWSTKPVITQATEPRESLDSLFASTRQAKEAVEQIQKNWAKNHSESWTDTLIKFGRSNHLPYFDSSHYDAWDYLRYTSLAMVSIGGIALIIYGVYNIWYYPIDTITSIKMGAGKTINWITNKLNWFSKGKPGPDPAPSTTIESELAPTLLAEATTGTKLTTPLGTIRRMSQSMRNAAREQGISEKLFEENQRLVSEASKLEKGLLFFQNELAETKASIATRYASLETWQIKSWLIAGLFVYDYDLVTMLGILGDNACVENLFEMMKYIQKDLLQNSSKIYTLLTGQDLLNSQNIMTHRNFILSNLKMNLMDAMEKGKLFGPSKFQILSSPVEINDDVIRKSFHSLTDHSFTEQGFFSLENDKMLKSASLMLCYDPGNGFYPWGITDATKKVLMASSSQEVKNLKYQIVINNIQSFLSPA